MIKVQAVVREYKENGLVIEKLVEESHEGDYAKVYNGVLTIYSDNSEPDIKEFAVAGYMPSSWSSWKKI